jgi:hypothetical protein
MSSLKAKENSRIHDEASNNSTGHCLMGQWYNSIRAELQTAIDTNELNVSTNPTAQ